MKVKCGKETIEVSVEDLNLTVKELKQQLFEITNYTDIKLIHAGKVLKDDSTTIGSIPGGLNAKLTMMGSTAAALESLKDTQSNAHNKRIIDDLTEDPRQWRGTDTKSRPSARKHNPYKFEGIQTLPGLPNEDKAREILETLANDEGVLAVMAKHKWSVGALCELYPEGYVGVSDVCVMGLNENHGQRILLRLRTDDMKGFRKILSIRKVLCHELAHNVHSEHDSNFYVLMRQVEREIVELDWKNGKGRSLTGLAAPETYSPPTGTGTRSASSGPEVHVLGGSTDPLLQQLLPARFLAGTAALLRLTEEEKEVEDNCASRPGVNASAIHKPEDPISEQMVEEATAAKESKMEEEEPAPRLSSDHPAVSVDQEVPPQQQSDAMDVDASTTETPVQEDETPLAPSPPPSPPLSAPVIPYDTLQESILASIDDAVAFALSVESSGAPVEKLLALRDSFSLILAHIRDSSADDEVRATALLRCLQLLKKILSNAKVQRDLPRTHSVVLH